MTTSEVESRNVALSVRKSVENLVMSSQDAIGQSISHALTFSGVITQPNQGMQENKSSSRSPSPSLRHTEGALDILDNDKRSDKSDSSLQGSSLPNDIPIGIDVVHYQSKDGYKIASPNSARGGEGAGAVRVKKKSWYNSLYPTYKSKCEDFRRLFKELPDDERLIVDYSCALQRDILAHGRLYASQNYLCFYANIFGWETNLMLQWKDVTAITKEKTALVIPNAILVCTVSEKSFLTSFSGRDKAYLMLFRIWQNALMDQPMSSQEIWQWVHTCYGEELGFDSDEESGAPDAAECLPVDGSSILEASEEAVDSSSMEAGGGGGGGGEYRSVSRNNTTPPLITNGDSGFREREEAADTLPTDMSDTSESEPDKHHNNKDEEKCTASHEGKLILNQEFPFNIDQLFTMIFTNSKFNLELLAARGTTDYVQAPWQPQNGLKCRQVSYTLGLTSGPVGPKEVHVTETQVMNKCSKAGALYSIECTSENAGIPYADYFSVQAHYCLARRGERAALALYGHVKYKKTMWPLVKAFLEKSAMGGMEEFARLLEARLLSAARPAPPPAARPRRRRRRDVSPLSPVAAASVALPTTTVLSPRLPAAQPSRATTWLALVLVLLLAVNAVLYWKLYHTDHTRNMDLNHLHTRPSRL
ncbi:protein Aster-B-like isoform X2 [Pararge aegeria]|uniref:protein Aster-B-like isoform X2 n=1 Tax=Pararge aegeria TaxID=116150 RepID=UPI0019CFF224|nr:protein Aster-B-like isoform X2 [Pararge aegeria]